MRLQTARHDWATASLCIFHSHHNLSSHLLIQQTQIELETRLGWFPYYNSPLCFSVLGLKPKSVWTVIQCDWAAAFLQDFYLCKIILSVFVLPESFLITGSLHRLPSVPWALLPLLPMCSSYSSGISLYFTSAEKFSLTMLFTLGSTSKRNPCFYFFLFKI